MSVFIPIPKKDSAKEYSSYCTLISHASKVMLKILQAKFQQCMNRALLDVPAGLRKGRGTRDQIANILWIIEKARKFQKSIYFRASLVAQLVKKKLLLLLVLHSGFAGGRYGGLVFPSLEELSTLCCDPHKGFSVVNEAEVNVFLVTPLLSP